MGPRLAASWQSGQNISYILSRPQQPDSGLEPSSRLGVKRGRKDGDAGGGNEEASDAKQQESPAFVDLVSESGDELSVSAPLSPAERTAGMQELAEHGAARTAAAQASANVRSLSQLHRDLVTQQQRAALSAAQATGAGAGAGAAAAAAIDDAAQLAADVAQTARDLTDARAVLQFCTDNARPISALASRVQAVVAARSRAGGGGTLSSASAAVADGAGAGSSSAY